MRRFQECNWIVKIWRYRWYIPLPFKWMYYMYINPFIVIETRLNEETGYIEDTDNFYNPRGNELFSLLKGDSQLKMKWYYTTEEVFKRIKL